MKVISLSSSAFSTSSKVLLITGCIFRRQDHWTSSLTLTPIGLGARIRADLHQAIASTLVMLWCRGPPSASLRFHVPAPRRSTGRLLTPCLSAAGFANSWASYQFRLTRRHLCIATTSPQFTWRRIQSTIDGQSISSSTYILFVRRWPSAT